jgi:hypothetical protein
MSSCSFTALRRALNPLDQRPVGHQHRGLQPALQVHHDPFLVGVVRDSLQHEVPRNGVKEGPDVKIDNPVLPKTRLSAHRDRKTGEDRYINTPTFGNVSRPNLGSSNYALHHFVHRTCHEYT